MNGFNMKTNYTPDNIIIQSSINLHNSINNSENKRDIKIKRLTNFEYNKNVNIYEDENYEFKQFTINSEKDIYARLRQNMKYFSSF